eukprot:gene10755-7650_t
MREEEEEEEEVKAVLLVRWKTAMLVDKGAFGMVFHCEDLKGENDGSRVAIKAVQCDGHHATREATILRDLQHRPHPNIVKYHSHFQHNHRLYLEMDFIDGVNLRKTVDEWVKTSSRWTDPCDRQPLVKKWFYQLFSALRHLHEAEIVHRDIKPSNLVVKHTTKDLFVVDFGVSRRESKEATANRGTKTYNSPESQSGKVSAATDVWSAAVTFAALMLGPLRGVVATDEEFRAEVVRRVLNCHFVTEEVIQSVVWILKGVNVADRPTAQAILSFVRPHYTAAELAELPEERCPCDNADTVIESRSRAGHSTTVDEEAVGLTMINVGEIGRTVVEGPLSGFSAVYAADTAIVSPPIPVAGPREADTLNAIDMTHGTDNHGSLVPMLSPVPVNHWPMDGTGDTNDAHETTTTDRVVGCVGYVPDDASEGVDIASVEAPRAVVSEQMPTPNRTQESVPGPQWIMPLSDITDQSAALLLLTSLGFPESFYA